MNGATSHINEIGSNLSASLIALVLTQTALLSFTDTVRNAIELLKQMDL